MKWQEKAAAFNELDNSFRIQLRDNGEWYASLPQVEIGGNGCLISISGSGIDPQEAVDDLWKQLVDELPDDKRLVRNAHTDNRREYRWSVFMWKEV